MAAIHLLGIRHHGPGSARAVERALAAIEPDVVVVELPAEAESLVRYLADAALAPPVAMLGYVADEPARAVFYPFAAFSPEWVALRWASERGVAVRAFDLGLAQSLVWQDAADEPGTGRRHRRRAERDPLGELARAAGYDDAERWWEDVVEHRSESDGAGDALAPFVAVAEAMGAVRADAPAPVGEEAAREATMRQVLRTVAKTAERIAVVCGAWHVPALQEPWPKATVDAAVLRGLPKAKVAVTWVPWTHRRLGTASGYAAGVRSPGWYAHVFAHPGDEGVTRWFADAAALLRSRDHAVSPDHLIGAVRLARTVAALRDRPVPGLDEVMDAAHAVLADGRPGPLALIRDELVVGDALGSVPDDVPMVPLARDLTAQRKRVRLKPDAVSKVVELDLRTDAGRNRSHLLHRLQALGVRWGVPEEGRGSSGTFRETWRLQWEPELSIRLVEASALGTTVEQAASVALTEQAAVTTALADLTALLESALLADLPTVVAPLVERLAEHAAVDPDVEHLMDALVPLARALRYGDVRATDTSALADVIDGMVARLVAGLTGACASLDDEAAAAMADRLTAVQGALALVDHTARRRAWPEVLAVIAARDLGPGLVAGRAVRLVHDIGWWDADAVERRFARALSVGTPADAGAAFVEGFLAGSGTVLLHDAGLLALLDGWMATLPEATFTDVVPLLRRTFGAFASAERRQIGQLVAGRDASAAAATGWDLDPGRADAALATVLALLGSNAPEGVPTWNG